MWGACIQAIEVSCGEVSQLTCGAPVVRHIAGIFIHQLLAGHQQYEHMCQCYVMKQQQQLCIWSFFIFTFRNSLKKKNSIIISFIFFPLIVIIFQVPLLRPFFFNLLLFWWSKSLCRKVESIIFKSNKVVNKSNKWSYLQQCKLLLQLSAIVWMFTGNWKIDMILFYVNDHAIILDGCFIITLYS